MICYNSNLGISDVPVVLRIATFFNRKTKELVVLVKEEDKYVVATFDPDGFCNNAAEYSYEQAWRFFCELVSDELEKMQKTVSKPENPWELADRLKAEGMQCNCDLDNWAPEDSTGHSCVCRIHNAATGGHV